MSIATACENRAKHYYLNDINQPLVALLQEAIEFPERLYDAYKKIWEEQFCFSPSHVEHFSYIRDLFNEGDESPANMLYLLARCVKGSVRYSSTGKFNQGVDRRRHGTNPDMIFRNASGISRLLKGKTTFNAGDYRSLFPIAEKGDVIYMDPPYQGVSKTRDTRYFSGIDFNEFVSALECLNSRGVDYLISYDGKCGEKQYGKDLPDELGCRKVLLNAGKSTQATFLGETKITYEALYVSRGLADFFEDHQELLLLEA